MKKFRDLKLWQKGGLTAVFVQFFLMFLAVILLPLGFLYSGFILALNFVFRLLAIVFFSGTFLLKFGLIGDFLSIVVGGLISFLIGAIIGEIYSRVRGESQNEI